MRQKILTLLRNASGNFISGAHISKKLHISKAAVWKHIRALRHQNIEIEAVASKGYRLVPSSNILSTEALQGQLNTRYLGRNVLLLDKAPSTNLIAKQLAEQACPHGIVVTAEVQTAGRGRRGRSWSNTPGKDICMSIVLRPNIETQYASRYTIAASLGLFETALSYGVPASIKWPNDILLNNRKVSGILLQMVGDVERMDAVIIGIGINVNTLLFPEEIKNIATSFALETSVEIDRNAFLGRLLNHLEPFFDACETESNFLELLDKYRAYCGTLGKQVKVMGIIETFEGLAENVDDNGRLLVRLNDGQYKTVGAADVSVRSTE